MRRAIIEWGLVSLFVLSLAIGLAWVDSLTLQLLHEPVLLGGDVCSSMMGSYVFLTSYATIGNPLPRRRRIEVQFRGSGITRIGSCPVSNITTGYSPMAGLSGR